MGIYALVPARYGSKGVPMKNHRPMAGGPSPTWRAINCAQAVPAIDTIIVSADADEAPWNMPDATRRLRYLRRPDRLAQDDTPMVEVVKDAMLSYPGEPNDVWLILQPTQPLRKPKHVTKALELLTPEVDSVVSVVETTSPDELLVLDVNGCLMRQDYPRELESLPPRRQDMTRGYKRDGTVYAFWRKSVRHNQFYGNEVRPLIIDPADTCPLDTPQDWAEAERRLRERN